MQTKVIPIRATIASSQDKPEASGDRARFDPTPAGLVVFAVACAGFFALLTGGVGSSDTPLLGGWLLAGFVIQLAAALLERKSGRLAGGSAFLFFSAIFMLAGGLGLILKSSVITAGILPDGLMGGWAWAALTLAVWLWTPAFWAAFSLLSAIVVLLDVALPFIALTSLRILPQGFLLVSAWALLLAGAVAVYLSAAIVVNSARGKRIYPLPEGGGQRTEGRNELRDLFHQ